MKTVFTFIVTCFCMVTLNAQDIHFARIQDMTRWYNQSLQINKNTNAAVNYRNVNYKGIIAFRSAALLADVSFLEKEDSASNKGYLSISGGASVDKSNSSILKNSIGLLGVAYSLPLNVEGTTFAAAGFQGTFFQSNVNMTNATMPDNFDKYGVVPGRSSSDPLQTSSVSYFSINAGLSVFHKGEKEFWYAGASARHVNRPQTQNGGGDEYKLPMTIGAQFGYGRSVSAEGSLNLYSVLNWKAEAYEHLLAVQYMHDFKEHNKGAGIGVGYRYNDAIIPSVEFRLDKTIFGFNYDYNISNIKSDGLNRTCYELGIKHTF